jgi:hypothetical protein
MKTNEELYKDEAEKIAKNDKTNHPAIYNGKPVPCIGFDCYKCDLHKPNSDAGCSVYYRDWLKSEAEPDKQVPKKTEEKVKKAEIKVGDTVKVTMKNHMREGATGTVRTINRAKNGIKFYYVRFDGESCGYAFLEYEIEKVKPKKTPPSIVVYRDGDTVTARDLETGETASAVCSKKDTFDIHTGAFIAMARLTHFMDDIRMMRLEAEQIEGDIADMKMRFGALMGEGYKYPEGFFREEGKEK